MPFDINKLFGTTSREEAAANNAATGLEEGFIVGERLLKLLAQETLNKPREYREGFLAGLKDAL